MKIIEPDKKMNWKSGKVNEASQLKYEEYIENLKKKYLKDVYSSSTNPISHNDTKNHNETPDVQPEEPLCSDENQQDVDENNEGTVR